MALTSTSAEVNTSQADPSSVFDLPTASPQSVSKESTLNSVLNIEAAGLSTVLKRHGRVDLVPMPSDSPLDPLNWPS